MNMTFSCAICEEGSTGICDYCTKDTCGNHLCERCFRCSDCCDCEVRLEDNSVLTQRQQMHGNQFAPPDPEPHPHPGPDPDPEPAPDPFAGYDPEIMLP